jgi:hypothetical protein
LSFEIQPSFSKAKNRSYCHRYGCQEIAMARPEVTGRQVEADEDAASGPGRLRPEVTARKIGVKSAKPDTNRIRGLPATDDADAFSVAAFCRRHGISPQLFYKFKNEMPATFRVGTRVLISKEAAAAWRRGKEAASSATA